MIIAAFKVLFASKLIFEPHSQLPGIVGWVGCHQSKLFSSGEKNRPVNLSNTFTGS